MILIAGMAILYQRSYHTITVLLICMYHTGSIKINVAVLTPVVIALLNKMGSQTTPPHPTKGGNVDSKAKKPK